MVSNLDIAIELINKYEEDLTIREETSDLTLVLLGRIFQERNIYELDDVVAGCLYAACRKNGDPVTIHDISEVTNIDKNEIGGRYRMISKVLNMNIKPRGTRIFIPHYCNELNYDEEVVNESFRTYEIIADKGLLVGHEPHKFASGIIYYNKKSDISRISEVSKTSEDKIERINDIIEHNMDNIE